MEFGDLLWLGLSSRADEEEAIRREEKVRELLEKVGKADPIRVETELAVELSERINRRRLTQAEINEIERSVRRKFDGRQQQ